MKPESEQQRERITHYHRVLYRENQRLMADATGFTQSYVSKILSGAQRPSSGFLDALARQPLVNRNWLLTGQGQPLLPSTAGSLPISTIPLPGPPTTHPGLLSGRRHPVGTALGGPRSLLAGIGPRCQFCIPGRAEHAAG